MTSIYQVKAKLIAHERALDSCDNREHCKAITVDLDAFSSAEELALFIDNAFAEHIHSLTPAKGYRIQSGTIEAVEIPFRPDRLNDWQVDWKNLWRLAKAHQRSAPEGSDLAVGDSVIYINPYGVQFLKEILGFDEDGQAYIFTDSHWVSTPVEKLIPQHLWCAIERVPQ